MSILDRTPPPNSLAADILGATRSNLTLKATKSIFSNIADIQESLSDFNSCQESSAGSSSSEEENSLEEKQNGFLTVNEINRQKRNKRKLALTPRKEEFLKKPNTKN